MSLSALQMAAVVSLSGSLAAVFVPTFLDNFRASRFAEPLDGLANIAAASCRHAAGEPVFLAFPEAAPRTPAQVPAGVMAVDPPGTWSHPSWRLLDFRMDHEHFYSFEYESHLAETSSTFEARALGDLDGDGEYSRFSVAGEMKAGGEPYIYPVAIVREVE